MGIASGQQVYYKYDTHWNDIGAYVGYVKIMDVVDPFGNIPRVTLNDVSLTKMVKVGDLARLLGNVSLRETVARAKIPVSAVVKRVNYENKEKYEVEEWISITRYNGAPTAICFCDSFVNGSLYKYLEQSFSRIVFKHHGGMAYDKRLIEKYRPDFVFYVVAERLIPYKLEN